MSVSLVMLGAGNSTRFNLSAKKQWLRTKNEPLWLYVTKKISSMYDFDKVIIVSSKDEISYMSRFGDFTFCKGGNERQESLKNALLHVKSKYVMVSDIARVCVNKKIVLDLINSKTKATCIVPALNVIDTIHYKNKPISREEVKRIQTPQLSHTKSLKQALNTKKIFTDDSSAILANGGNVHYINGDEDVYKLTCKEDLKRLTCLKSPSSNTFVGTGFDVHAFGAKRKLLLGGIEVHENMGLKAHSDGDVLAHALIDGILGACGMGDVGELFPDTDEKYKNANSMELLRKVYDFVLSVGFTLVNADITIMAQSPKISPFKQEIAKNIAKCLQEDTFRINIKATTTENLGFVGRKEGIAVQVGVGLKYFDWTKI